MLLKMEHSWQARTNPSSCGASTTMYRLWLLIMVLISLQVRRVVQPMVKLEKEQLLKHEEYSRDTTILSKMSNLTHPGSDALYWKSKPVIDLDREITSYKVTTHAIWTTSLKFHHWCDKILLHLAKSSSNLWSICSMSYLHQYILSTRDTVHRSSAVLVMILAWFCGMQELALLLSLRYFSTFGYHHFHCILKCLCIRQWVLSKASIEILFSIFLLPILHE